MTVKKSTIYTLISVLIMIIVIIVGTSFLQFTLSKSSQNTISAEEINKTLDDLKKDDEPTSTTPEIKDDEKPTTSYGILEYAYNNVNNEANVIMTTNSVSGKLGFDQHIRNIYKRSGTEISDETFAYGNASFLKSFYEYCYTKDQVNCEYIYTNNIDQNYNYDLSGSSVEEMTLDYIRANVRQSMMKSINLIPNKSLGIITSFDRVSDPDYIIIKFSFTTVPSFYSDNYKNELNSSYVSFQSITMTSYIEKSTYRLKLLERYENYSFNASPVGEMSVSLSSTIKIQYPSSLTIEPLIKNNYSI